MKKAKLMLVSLAVLAVVGGGFAFKAKSYFVGGWYCTPFTFNGRHNLICSTEYFPSAEGVQEYCNTNTCFNLATTQVFEHTVIQE
jgi:hypothetical protein